MTGLPGDVEDAARLVAWGWRPRQLPARDASYAELVRRFAVDEDFAELVRAVGRGMGVPVLSVSMQTGTVLAPTEGSVFEVRIDEYARRAAFRGRRDTEKVLHGLIHLAVAALAFPRADDLANKAYIGRTTVEQVDLVVREACRLLEERARAAEENSDPLDSAPELERLWRVYSRRPEAAAKKDGNLLPDTTRAMITKALRFLTEQGFLTQVGTEGGGTFRTTPRYQVQVRELAAEATFRELLRLGVVVVAGPGGGLSVGGDADV